MKEVTDLNIYEEQDRLEWDEDVHTNIRVLNRVYSPECSAHMEPERPVCRISPRCEGCPYPAHGFVCWGGDGNCIRSRIAKINQIEGGESDAGDAL